MKDETFENNWTFELGAGNGNDVPLHVIVGYIQRDQFNQQHRKNDTFYRPSVINAPCKIGSKKNTDASIICIYAIEKNSQAYEEFATCFRDLAKDNIFLPYNTQRDFLTSINYPDGIPDFNL